MNTVKGNGDQPCQHKLINHSGAAQISGVPLPLHSAPTPRANPPAPPGPRPRYLHRLVPGVARGAADGGVEGPERLACAAAGQGLKPRPGQRDGPAAAAGACGTAPRVTGGCGSDALRPRAGGCGRSPALPRPPRPKGYCLSSASTSGPASGSAAAASSGSSTKRFSSYWSMSRRRKRDESVLRAIPAGPGPAPAGNGAGPGGTGTSAAPRPAPRRAGEPLTLTHTQGQ